MSGKVPSDITSGKDSQLRVGQKSDAIETGNERAQPPRQIDEDAIEAVTSKKAMIGAREGQQGLCTANT